MRGIIGALFGIGLTLLAVGFGVGYLAFQPTISFLQGSEQEQRRQLETTKDLLSKQTTAVEGLLIQLWQIRTERSRLAAELGVSKGSLEQTSTSLKKTRETLNLLRKDVAPTLAALSALDVEAVLLRSQVQSLDTSEQKLNDAINLQADIAALAIERLRPALGDGELLARQAVRATQAENYSNAVIYFNTASVAYQTAEKEMKATTDKYKELMDLVPEELHSSFNNIQKQYEARLRAVGSRIPEYQAAANFHVVIDEWQATEGAANDEQLQRWTTMSDEGDNLIQEALDLLEEADKWAPNLWREFEAQRLEIRDWQALLDGIRFFILEE
jgi:hypothetical protein